MKLIRNEEGQTLVLTAVCASGLIGFMALALDVGVLFHTRREIQSAADAAALAGAADYLYNQSKTSARTAACAAAAANGFSGNCIASDSSGACTGTGTTICVNIPPMTGPNTTTAGTFVEAIVAQPTSTIFRSGSIAVNARAVGATPTNGQACIWLMASSGPAFDVQGSYDIEATGCGIYVNSNTTDAMGVTGNGGKVNSQFIDVVGNSTLQHQTTPTPATMNSGYRKSPWGNLQGPCYDTASCTAAQAVNPGQTNACNGSNSTNATTITSGTTIPASSNGVVCFTGGSLSHPPIISGATAFTFPGASSGITYVFTNGVEIATGTTVTFGSGPTFNQTSGTFPITPATIGATLDVGNGTLKQDSSSLLNIYAPAKSSSSTDGIAIMQSPWNTGTLQLQFGSNNEVLDGYIFAPGGEVYLQDSGGGVTATGLVAKELFDKTTTFTVSKSYDQANPTTTLNKVLTIVE